MARWEANQADLNAAAARRVQRVASILARLAGVMRRAFIPTWLDRPNDACKEIGVCTPLDLYEKGDYETIERMIWYIESGSPE